MIEILVEIGDWNVVRWSSKIDEEDKWDHAYASHKISCGVGGPYKLGLEWEHTDREPVCWSCGEHVPEEVRGVVLLANFDDVCRGGL